jgi:hypothetical protein
VPEKGTKHRATLKTPSSEIHGDGCDDNIVQHVSADKLRSAVCAAWAWLLNDRAIIRRSSLQLLDLHLPSFSREPVASAKPALAGGSRRYVY